jgi:hypothetical protein
VSRRVPDNWCGDAQRGSACTHEVCSREQQGQQDQARAGQVARIEQEKETGHSPNMRYSGPQLLSSWLHGASAVGNQAANSLAGLGPLGPLS